MECDLKKVVKLVSDFKDLMNSLPSLLSQCDQEIRECDSALCDIRHRCEVAYPTNRHTRTQICKLLKEYSERRRKAKDIQMVIKPIYDFFEAERKQDYNIYKNLATMANEVVKEQKFINGNRTYKPRIIQDIFSDDIKGA